MVVATIVAPLVARAGDRLASGPALVAGLVVALLGFAAVRLVGGPPSAVAVAMATGLGLGLHLGKALPFVLGRVASGRAGLATGLYVGGAMLGGRLVQALLAS
jgi:hypothetical protein